MTTTQQLLDRWLAGDEAAWGALRQPLQAQLCGLLPALIPGESTRIDLPSLVDRVLERVRKQLESERIVEESHFERAVISSARQELVAALIDGTRGELTPKIEHKLRRQQASLQTKISASEVWQLTQWNAVRSADRFVWQGDQAFQGWLAQIANNVIRERRRYWKRQRRDVRRDLPQQQESDAIPPQHQILAPGASPSAIAVQNEALGAGAANVRGVRRADARST